METTKEKLLLTGILILLLGIGFYAGRVSAKIENVSSEETIQDVGEISETLPTINFTAFDKGMLYGKSNGKDLRIFVNDQIIEEKNDGAFFIDTGSIKESAVSGNNEKYLYVASKNSKKYHPIGSSAANRIKAENRIYFVSKEDAEKKGLTPGSEVE